MTGGARRLAALAGLVLGLLLALELFCRALPEGLAAVAHRVRFKLALLHRQSTVDVVAFGSSRTNDGFSPARLQEASGARAAFNAATPSSSLPTLEFLAGALALPGPATVLVELARPQSTPGEMDAVSTPKAEDYLGDPLGFWLATHSALLARRRAFALENLPRVAGLVVADALDGSEWFRSMQLVETFRPPAPPAGVADEAAWRSTPPAEAPELLDEDAPRVVEGYARAVAALRAKGHRVVLVTPPLASPFRAEECTPRWNATRAAVAARTGAPHLDFGCAAVDDRWFVDGQHLGSPGRAKYSTVLGEELRALP